MFYLYLSIRTKLDPPLSRTFTGHRPSTSRTTYVHRPRGSWVWIPRALPDPRACYTRTPSWKELLDRGCEPGQPLDDGHAEELEPREDVRQVVQQRICHRQ